MSASENPLMVSLSLDRLGMIGPLMVSLSNHRLRMSGHLASGFGGA